MSIFALGAFAQTEDPLQYDMDFVGRGEATTVQTVTVENLSSGETLTLDGNSILRLTNATSEPQGIDGEAIPKIASVLFPNPSYGQANLTFANRTAGEVNICIFNIAGKMLRSGSFHLETGVHTALLPAMAQGNYIVSLRGKGINESVKWTSLGDGWGGGISMKSGSWSDEVSTNSGGASANAPAPIKAPVPQRATSEATIVEMPFHNGELLRFTGTSGNMKTVVMNQPTLSHAITFDFYECKDAAGRNYPIVNVGGILWMAEDLGVVPEKASVRTSANGSSGGWADYELAKVAYRDFNPANADKGGYYNYAGAKAALPEGWNLPTAGEVDYMFQKLGMTAVKNTAGIVTGYANQRPDLLKSRGNSWATPETAPDTTSFDAVATGALSTAGVFSAGDYKTQWWTNSTKNLAPLWWGIEHSSVKLLPDQTADAQNGFRVRGCRPAPSALADVVSVFGSTPTNAPQRAPAATQLFESGPIGGMYTVVNEKHKVFTTELTSYPYKDKLNGFNFQSGSSYTVFNVDTKSITTGADTHLSKMCGQNNATGRQNLIRAIWNRTGTVTDATYQGKFDYHYGAGTVSFEIFADSLDGYARLDSITLPVEYTMPDARSEASNVSYEMAPNSPTLFCLPDAFAKRFQLASADFNEDGIGDIVLMMGNRIDIYDGTDYTTLLATKTFTGGVTPEKKLRFAAGDVDNDNRPDIAVIYPLDAENAQIEVYKDGILSNNASYFATVTVKKSNEIQIGEVTGNGKNDIVVVTYDWMRNTQYTDKLTIFQYSSTQLGGLQKIADKTFDSDQSGRTEGNANLVLCRTRGAKFAADIVFRHYQFRWNQGAGEIQSITPGFNYNSGGNTYIPADAMAAANVNNNEDGIEKLCYYSVSPGYNTPTYTDYIRDDGSVERSYFGIQFNKNLYIGTSNIKSFQYDYVGLSLYQANGATSFSYWYSTFSLNPCHPLATARSSEPAKVFKFKGHKTTMSEPRIYALLAAPPFYKYDIDGNEFQYGNFSSMGTSWGRTETSSSSHSSESSYSVAAIIGTNVEFNAPIVATKIGEVDFTTKLEQEWTEGAGHQVITEQSIDFTAPQNDAVILSATFFDSYTYEVIASGKPEEIGAVLTISLPSQQRTLGLNLLDYNRMAADNPEVPNLSKVFKHKVGFPFSYPSEKTQIQSNVAGSTVLWAMPFGGEEFIGIGSGTDVNRAISLTEETSQSMGSSFNMDMELVATVGVVKAGAGFGYGNTNTSTHAEEVGHAISGNVAGLATLGEHGLGDFKWTVCWYKYRIGNQEFPVVNYVVKP